MQYCLRFELWEEEEGNSGVAASQKVVDRKETVSSRHMSTVQMHLAGGGRGEQWCGCISDHLDGHGV